MNDILIYASHSKSWLWKRIETFESNAKKKVTECSVKRINASKRDIKAKIQQILRDSMKKFFLYLFHVHTSIRIKEHFMFVFESK